MPFLLPRRSTPASTVILVLLFCVALHFAWNECRFFLWSRTTTGVITSTHPRMHSLEIDYNFADADTFRQESDNVPPLWPIPPDQLVAIDYIPHTHASRIAGYPDKLWPILASAFLLAGILSVIADYRRIFAPRRSPFYK
ncbi:MAG TPA: hypothetical protein VM008_12690 [Phycisphaerae bacterium]|nr:hypothetical protein [Phycisphaerae bacterium]